MRAPLSASDSAATCSPYGFALSQVYSNPLETCRIRGRFGSSHCCSSMSLICAPVSVSVTNWLRNGWLAKTSPYRAILFLRNIGADTAGIGQRDHGAAILVGAGRGQLRVGDDIAKHALAGLVGHARQRVGDRSRPALGDRSGELVVSRDQRGLVRILGQGGIADDDIVGLGADDVVRRGIEFDVDRGDEGAVFVA